MGRALRVGCALAVLAFFVAASWKYTSRGAEVKAAPPDAAAQSSLDLGAPFDSDAKARFEKNLSPADAPRLVRLKSRFALCDADCPIPAISSTPFYVTFRNELSRALADELSAAGMLFMGYVWPRTHIVRAADDQTLAPLQEMLRGNADVLGTLLQRREDKLSRGAFERAPGGDYQVLFWRGTRAEDAWSLLMQAGAAMLEGTLDAQGKPTLGTPFVNVRVDAQGFAALAQSDLVEHVGLAPWRVADNQTSVDISNAEPAVIGLAPYNLDGTDQIAGVWDNGPTRDTHEQFQNAPSPSLINNGTKRVRRMDTQSAQDHETHVTGTIIGDGTGNATARGYAPRAYALAYYWSNVDQKRRDAKHTWNHVADNHSYASFGGGNDDWGEYTAECQVNDFTNRDGLMNMVQAAGNYQSSQPGGSGPKPYSDGSQTVPSFNAHRNGFIIGAVQDNLDFTGFTSLGPCGDGRLVPQFSANGEGLTSAIRSSDTAYASFSGTSMACPSTTGALVLLSQLWRRLHSNRMLEPDTARSVLALTCQDRGNTGPDYIYGFGIVDVQAAADLMLADSASGGKRIMRGAVRQGSQVEYTINVPAASPALRVSCSWLDIYASLTSQAAVVNDLDLELVDPSNTVRYPYAGLLAGQANARNHVFTTTGANRRDNIELCHVANPAQGAWRVRVRGFSIPANPQTATPNNVCGFVLASNMDMQSLRLAFEDPLNTGTPVAIPDNNATGIIRTFNVSDTRVITHVRVHARIMHERRGDVQIILESPLATMVNLKTVNTGDQDDYTDVIGVFPDTRQYDDDITALIHQHISGQWRVHVRDRATGNTGTLNYLALEFELRVNNAPNADAGTAFSVREAANGQLNASASSDPDGDPITYQWAQVAGAVSVSLTGAATATPTFTAPAVSQDEVVTFQVTVRDASLDSDTHTVQVTILNNAPPTASAGNDVQVRENLPVQLDASGSSNIEGDPLTYAWTQLSGTSVTLSGAATVTASFTSPSVSADEDLVFRVTVTDNRGDFTTDTVTVSVINNLAPQANAGTDVSVREAAGVGLDASASTDPESDSLTYAWTQASGVTAALTGAATATPTVNAPSVNQDEILVFQVTVTDDRGDFTTDTVQVTVLNNAAPSANAGADFGVLESGSVQLDASSSSNVESDPLTYAWTQTLGTSVTLIGAATATPSFTAPMVAANEVLEFEVTVTDDRGDFSTDRVQVTVEENLPPVANAGPDSGLMFSAPGQLNGAASSDPNTGDTLTYSWIQLSGTGVGLTGANTATPTFLAPTSDARLEFELTVTDSFGLTDTDVVIVYVNSTGYAGAAGGKKKDDGGGCSSGDDKSALWLLVGAMALGLWLRRLVAERKSAY